MFIAVLLFMLLFTGFCAVILAMAISDAFAKGVSEKPNEATIIQTRNIDSDIKGQVKK